MSIVKLKFSITRILILFLIQSCSVKWSDTMSYGSVSPKLFSEEVPIDIQNHLVFVPVTIKGNTYRFLWDTGAPLSISKPLQEKLQFKTLTTGTIKDSDHNKKKVNWVQLDSLHLGKLLFKNHSAFVGDFEANPILKCLNIDGIIGSNLIRQAVWTIDQDHKHIQINNNSDHLNPETYTVIPFSTNTQYNMYINASLEKANIKNILVDYGSTGGLSLQEEIFNTIENHDIFNRIYTENGKQQSGIIGTAIPFNRKKTYTNSFSWGNTSLKNISVRSGKTTSIGNQVLAAYELTIDWPEQQLLLKPLKTKLNNSKFSGFKLGFNNNKTYIQSVTKPSLAYNAGLRPLQNVLELDTINFDKHSYCDYIKHRISNEIKVTTRDSMGQIKVHVFKPTLIN